MAAPPVKGDAAAWAEIVAAYRKLNGLSGYPIKSVVSGGGSGEGSSVWEVAPPNAYHRIDQSPQGTAETFSAGGKVVLKISGAGMPGGGQCRTLARDPNPNRNPLFRDPESPEDSDFQYTVTRKPDSMIDGRAVHTYGIIIDNVKHGGQSIPGTIYIEAQTGLPRRVVATVTLTTASKGSNQEITSTSDF